MSDLKRVLVALDKREAADLATLNDKRAEFYADASRVLRELAADLHTALDVYDGAGEINPEWIERVREKWRLEP